VGLAYTHRVDGCDLGYKCDVFSETIKILCGGGLSSMQNKDTAIKVDNVSKDFELPQEKVDSLKGAFVSMFRSRSKSANTQHALRDINFEVKKGEFFGVVGRNGSGKSTLLKILANIYQPTKGKVYTDGKLVAFIELGVGFNPELSGRENVYLNGAMLGFSRREVEQMYRGIVEFAELEKFMDQKLKNYSSGMQVRLAFSMAVRAQADILLIDEVLAVGDADFQRKCYEYFKTLKKRQKTVIFVSHDMGAVREFCDRALIINESEVMKIGKAGHIADEYNKLFILQTDKDDTHEELTDQNDSRWGDGKIKITEVHSSVQKSNIEVNVKARVQDDLDGVMYGIHISSQDGQELTAMNNRMLNKPDIKSLKTGQIVEFSWNMLNIFNDGKYFVTLTLVNEAGIAYDWFTDASSFIVKRAERSVTAILPPVEVNYRVKEARIKDGR
jgi:ABC-2 type transport system ATP-binding protein